jgi:putative FmdB family regulatory protein
MPLYEYYCGSCHGVFEELRQIRNAADPAGCPECGRDAPRIMSGFTAFTMRDGYPRKIPDKGTYWHMGQEVSKPATRFVDNTHPELARPKPKRRATKAEAADTREQSRLKRSDARYRDKWGITEHGFRSVKARKVTPKRKTV